MPTYEYKCNSCGNLFEVFQSMNAEPVKVCPDCGGKVKRLIGAGAGPIFKGTGFYQTDYKNNSTDYKSNSGSDKPAEKKDSKPAKSA